MPDNNEASQAGHAQAELHEERLYGTGAWNTLQARDGISNSNPGPKNAGVMRLAPNSDSPPATDHGSVGALWHSFELTHRRVQNGGWTHQVTEREVPLSKAIAGVNMHIVGGAFREAHWHLADEWATCSPAKLALPCLPLTGLCLLMLCKQATFATSPQACRTPSRVWKKTGVTFYSSSTKAPSRKRVPSCSPTGSSTRLQTSCVNTCACIRKRSRSCLRGSAVHL